MRHLVAGGAGFIGSHLCDRLLELGHEVIAIDDLCTGTRENLRDATRSGRFTFVEADITREVPTNGRVDRVWNLASPASPPEYARLSIETLRVGSVGTHNLLEVAKRDGARFLMASTSEVYGDPDVTPQPESYWGRVNPIGPRSVYDEAKRFSEAITAAYRRDRGVDTRIARIFNTYGPRMRLDDGRIVPNFIGQALRGEPLTIYGDGSQTRSFCFVTDEIEGLLRLMDGTHPGPINIGNPREITVLELARAIEELHGGRLPVVFKPLPQDDPKQRCPDITLARQELGWEPRVGLEEGLARTYASFRELNA